MIAKFMKWAAVYSDPDWNAIICILLECFSLRHKFTNDSDYKVLIKNIEKALLSLDKEKILDNVYVYVCWFFDKTNQTVLTKEDALFISDIAGYKGVEYGETIFDCIKNRLPIPASPLIKNPQHVSDCLSTEDVINIFKYLNSKEYNI